MKKLAVIDTHFHIWDLEQVKLAWLDNRPDINRTISFEEFLDFYKDRNLLGALYIESDSEDKQAELAYIGNLLRQKSRILGLVLGGTPGLIGELCTRDTCPRLRGFREVLHTPSGRSRLISGDFKKELTCLGGSSLVIELCMRGEDIAEALSLCKEYPGLNFVLDHLGNPPYEDQAALEQWEENITRLGMQANVYCKLSSMDSFSPSTPDFVLESLVKTCVTSFGAQRLVFGSNFPVSGLDPATWLGKLENLLGDLGLRPDELEQIFYRNALRLYDLILPRRRFGQVIKLKQEKLEEYKKLHSNVWPGVTSALKRSNFHNYSIFYKAGFLFGYFEYAGEDFEADSAKIANDPVTKLWWQLTDECQERIEGAMDSEWWSDMEEFFHLD